MQVFVEVFLEAVRSSGSVLRWAAPQFQEDMQIALAAIANNPSAAMWLGIHLHVLAEVRACDGMSSRICHSVKRGSLERLGISVDLSVSELQT